MTQVYKFKVTDQYGAEYCPECFKNNIESQNLDHSYHGKVNAVTVDEAKIILMALREVIANEDQGNFCTSQTAEFKALLQKVYDIVPSDSYAER